MSGQMFKKKMHIWKKYFIFLAGKEADKFEG